LKYIVARLLLFFYLSSAYLSATHIHHDNLVTSIDNCKVHFLVKNLNSADIPKLSFKLLVCLGCFEAIGFYTHEFFQPTLKGFDAQAPPFYS
jgi:hypothetical protein